MIVTASGDKTVRLWSLKDGSCLKTFEGHTASVLRVSFLSVGTQLLSAGADGLLKLWSIKSTECLNTFELHEDKVWAMSVSGGASNEALVATGGADSLLCLWEDSTVQDEQERAREDQEAILKEQQLMNALSDRDYLAAARIAFDLKHPGRLLSVVQKILSASGSPRHAAQHMRALAAALEPEQLRLALEYSREWNTRARTCHAAQSMLQAVVRSRRPEELAALPGVKDLVDALVPYTQRHMSRMDRLLRSAFLLDYTLQSMKVVLDGPDSSARHPPAPASAPAPSAAVAKRTAANDEAELGGDFDIDVSDDYGAQDGVMEDASDDEDEGVNRFQAKQDSKTRKRPAGRGTGGKSKASAAAAAGSGRPKRTKKA